MVVVGNFRNRAEMRNKARRQFQYTARIFIDKQTAPIKCTIVDISASGGRVVLQNEQDLPEHFILFITQNGSARRYCRVVWRNGPTVGVVFTSGIPKAPGQEPLKPAEST